MNQQRVARQLVKIAKGLVEANASNEVYNLWEKVNGLSDCLNQIAAFVSPGTSKLSKEWTNPQRRIQEDSNSRKEIASITNRSNHHD